MVVGSNPTIDYNSTFWCFFYFYSFANQLFPIFHHHINHSSRSLNSTGISYCHTSNFLCSWTTTAAKYANITIAIKIIRIFSFTLINYPLPRCKYRCNICTKFIDSVFCSIFIYPISMNNNLLKFHAVISIY